MISPSIIAGIAHYASRSYNSLFLDSTRRIAASNSGSGLEMRSSIDAVISCSGFNPNRFDFILT
jgi:hypothetical protein